MTEPTAKRAVPQDVAVLLFADIADSTLLTEQLGDATFRERARDLDTALRSAIRDHDGIPIAGKLLGDGVMATFASAHQAIECAIPCSALGEDVGLSLHLGIHAGDVIREEDNVYGGAVNIAARIADTADPGEILVSETVRGLARTSAPVDFDDRGEYVLKGVADKHRLYTVRLPGEPEPQPRQETKRSAKALGSHVILFTDLQKGSHIAERIEDPDAQALMWEHITIVEHALQLHGSAEVKTAGDGYMALFTSPTSALDSAIAIQRTLADRNRQAEHPLLVQMGLNAGEPVRVGPELHGAAVVLAWRAAGAAGGGQILATEAVRQLVLGKGYRFTECGQTELRSTAEPVRLYELSWAEE